MSPRWLTVLPVLALLALAPAAMATTNVRVQQIEGLDVVVAEDDDSAANLLFGRFVGDEDTVAGVQNTGPGGVTVGAGCELFSATAASCPGEFDAVVVIGNGGDDQVTLTLISLGMPPIEAAVEGGPGNDTIKSPPDTRDVPQPQTLLQGGAGDDEIVGGNGVDELHGGEGNDTIQGFSGADSVFGEAGNDTVSAGKEEPLVNAADVLDGGPGVDAIPDVDADYNRGNDDDVSVTMDGVANDGEPGEGDNVTNVEKFRVVAEHASVSGTPAADDIFVDAFATSTLRGGAGNDRLIAYDGGDTIEGGDGDDYLEGGFGNDVLDGGSGTDQFAGDRTESNVIAIGNDDIRARDGIAEQIGCGIGSDVATVDSADVTSADCEDVRRPDPVELVPGDPAVTGKSTPRAVARRGLLITIACPAACEVTARLRVSKKVARKLKLGRSRILARGSGATTGAGDARVTLKVAKKARKRLKRQRRVKTTLVTRTLMAGAMTEAEVPLTLRR